MNRLRRIVLTLGLVFLAASVGHADTGTCRILDYRVRLTPHSDGMVLIEYYQKWQVDSGHIPWITVGLPNHNFQVQSSGLNARNTQPANEGDWSGVRIDLDKDYRPRQTFEVRFGVSQQRLFYADAQNYRLDFTPGWYDRAKTDSLEIRIKYFAKPETVTAKPEPTSREGEELVWKRSGLGEGERVSVSIAFPKTVLAQPIPNERLERQQGAPSEGPAGAGSGIGVVLAALGVIVFLVFITYLVRNHWGDGYSGGTIFYGGSGRGGSGRGGGGGIFSGGGGGFGGGGFSCACACVSCACACACAGGGGAGCSLKLLHSCSLCRDRLKGRAG